MYNHPKSGFPDPLAPKEDKDKKSYGLQYAKAIESQWGKLNEKSSIFGKRNDIFERNRKYANGTQDTSIYKQLLNSLQPNSSDGSLLNLDFTPVPILPKFVRIVVNKILSRDPYPNLEAVDPLSSSEKNQKKNRLKNQVILKDKLKELKENTGGIVLDEDPDNLPDTLEEAENLLKMRKSEANSGKLIIKELGPNNPDVYEMVPTLIADSATLKKFLLPMKAYMYEGGFVDQKNIFTSLL